MDSLYFNRFFCLRDRCFSSGIFDYRDWFRAEEIVQGDEREN